MSETIFNKEYQHISLKAKAIYFYFKTANDISKLTINGMADISQGTKKTIALGVTELIDNGFMKRERIGNNGRVLYTVLK